METNAGGPALDAPGAPGAPGWGSWARLRGVFLPFGFLGGGSRGGGGLRSLDDLRGSCLPPTLSPTCPADPAPTTSCVEPGGSPSIAASGSGVVKWDPRSMFESLSSGDGGGDTPRTPSTEPPPSPSADAAGEAGSPSKELTCGPTSMPGSRSWRWRLLMAKG